MIYYGIKQSPDRPIAGFMWRWCFVPITGLYSGPTDRPLAKYFLNCFAIGIQKSHSLLKFIEPFCVEDQNLPFFRFDLGTSKMDETKLAAAITLKRPEQLSWAVQAEDQSWTGTDMRGFLNCIGEQAGQPITLSVSLLFELTGNEGTVRSGE